MLGRFSWRAPTLISLVIFHYLNMRCLFEMIKYTIFVQLLTCQIIYVVWRIIDIDGTFMLKHHFQERALIYNLTIFAWSINFKPALFKPLEIYTRSFFHVRFTYFSITISDYFRRNWIYCRWYQWCVIYLTGWELSIYIVFWDWRINLWWVFITIDSPFLVIKLR